MSMYERESERERSAGDDSVTFSDEELQEIVSAAGEWEINPVTPLENTLHEQLGGLFDRSCVGYACGIAAERARWRARVSAASDGLHALLGEGRR